MTPSENAAIVRRWFDEVWNQRRDATVHELLDPSSVGHLEGLVAHGVAEFFAARSFLLKAFPDLRVTVEAVLADEDEAAVRWAAEGRHEGELLGIAATGRPIAIRGMTWLRLSNGRIVKGWDSWNQGRLMNELRAAAASAAA
jgi:predicted ester cyclase